MQCVCQTQRMQCQETQRFRGRTSADIVCGVLDLLSQSKRSAALKAHCCHAHARGTSSYPTHRRGTSRLSLPPSAARGSVCGSRGAPALPQPVNPAGRRLLRSSPSTRQSPKAQKRSLPQHLFLRSGTFPSLPPLFFLFSEKSPPTAKSVSFRPSVRAGLWNQGENANASPLPK